jgi:hypothetical protein
MEFFGATDIHRALSTQLSTCSLFQHDKARGLPIVFPGKKFMHLARLSLTQCNLLASDQKEENERKNKQDRNNQQNLITAFELPPNLSQLTLSNCTGPLEFFPRLLRSLEQHPSLAYFSVSSSEATSDALAAALQNHSGMTRLELHGTSRGDPSAEALRLLQLCPSLCSLHLSQLPDELASHALLFAQWRQLTHLEVEMELDGDPTHACSVFLEELTKFNRTLTVVSLKMQFVDDGHFTPSAVQRITDTAMEWTLVNRGLLRLDLFELVGAFDDILQLRRAEAANNKKAWSSVAIVARFLGAHQTNALGFSIVPLLPSIFQFSNFSGAEFVKLDAFFHTGFFRALCVDSLLVSSSSSLSVSSDPRRKAKSKKHQRD